MTIIDVQDIVLDNFETESIELDHDTRKVTIYFEYLDHGPDHGAMHPIRIYLVKPDESKALVGCHVLVETPDDDYRIVDAIETALKDNYPAVYIHLKEGA